MAEMQTAETTTSPEEAPAGVTPQGAGEEAAKAAGETGTSAASASSVSLWDCAACKTRNPIGSKFCRECGEKLAEPENPLLREEAERAEQERRQERVAGLLADAFRLSEQGKYFEALPLAEEAVALLPESTSALAVLASLYERTRQPERAIAAMEHVVALNPDSTADKARLDRLRRGVPASPIPVPVGTGARKEPRSLPLAPLVFAGVASALIFGVLFSLLQQRTQKVAAAPRPQPTGYSPLSGPMPAASLPQSYANQQPSAPTPVGTPYTIHSLSPTPSAVTRAPQRTASTATRRSTFSDPMTSPLPLPGQTTSPPPGVAPVTLQPPPEGGAGSGFGNGGRIPVGPPVGGTGTSSGYPANNPNTGNNGGTATDGVAPNGGYIRIQVGGNGGNVQTNPGAPQPNAPQNPPPPSAGDNGGQSNLIGPASDDSPLSRARRLQAAKRYAEAITAYREAIASGAASGDAHLGIAQCYQQIGNADAARGSYGEAIRAYEAQIAAGRSSGAARQGIDTARAALDVLGG